jgi:hypothetical protein
MLLAPKKSPVKFLLVLLLHSSMQNKGAEQAIPIRFCSNQRYPREPIQ